MANDFDLLSEVTTHANLDGPALEQLGQRAAREYTQNGVPLNEAVVKLASEYPRINQEQVKRVCEFANTAVFLHKYAEAKNAHAETNYPQFTIADPAAVIQDMSDGGTPRIVPLSDPSYSSPPKREKTASAELDRQLEEMFKVSSADIDYSENTALKEVMDLQDTLRSMKTNLESSGERFDLTHKQASAEYYNTVKRHLLDGGSLAEVLTAANSTGVHQEKIALVLQPVVARLLKEKVASPKGMQTSLAGMSKLANRVLNAEHPLVKTFGAMLEFEHEMAKIAVALVEVEDGLTSVKNFMKKAGFMPAVKGAVKVLGAGMNIAQTAAQADGTYRKLNGEFDPNAIAAAQGTNPAIPNVKVV